MASGKTICAADLFCGAGGTSEGLVRAAHSANFVLELLAINHWATAVETHTRNHPDARHLCADLSTIDPSKVIPGGRLDLLVASPECTHHSVARGGKPCSDQSRASAWHILHWVERLQIENVLIENVGEFRSWGPLTRAGHPNKRLKGKTFAAFLHALESLGYCVEHRILNAADYGDATTRKRLFIQARRGHSPTWPETTHAGHWRPAREIIDWNLKGESIFTRKRPLKPNTLRRIEAGLKRYGGQPFLAILRGTSTASSVLAPMPTCSAGGGHFGLCEPFVLASGSRGQARPTSLPIPTITTTSRGMALVQPFIVQCGHSGGDRINSVDAPLPTITAGNRGAFSLCQPFVTKYYGKGTGARPVSLPLDTVTSKDRFALVEPTKMDILFRMLQPHELAAAMGFDHYDFAGNKTAQVRQIGNAVPVNTAAALCGNILRHCA